MAAGRWVSFPREPSVAGMLVLSGVAGLAAGWPGSLAAAAGLGVLLLHLLTFDPAFNALRARDWGRFAVLVAANAAPYVSSFLLGYMPPWVLAVSGLILVSHVALYTLRGPRSPIVYIYGAAIPVLPALTTPSLAGPPPREAVVVWVMLTGHAVATAAYVETRLPWRRLSPLAPLAPWLPAVAAAAALEPSALVAAVEPTAKLAVNIARKNRLIDPSPENIRRLGWTELARLVAFTAILLAAVKLA